MNVEELVRAIEAADWERFTGPEDYDAGRARQSLRNLARARDKADAETAYNEVLSGIGNNHGGSYYPAALDAIPLLVRIAASGREWARHGALEVLTDLLTSFDAEPGYESFNGQRIDLPRALHEAVRETGLLSSDRAKRNEPDRTLAELRAATET